MWLKKSINFSLFYVKEDVISLSSPISELTSRLCCVCLFVWHTWSSVNASFIFLDLIVCGRQFLDTLEPLWQYKHLLSERKIYIVTRPDLYVSFQTCDQNTFSWQGIRRGGEKWDRAHLSKKQCLCLWGTGRWRKQTMTDAEWDSEQERDKHSGGVDSDSRLRFHSRISECLCL